MAFLGFGSAFKVGDGASSESFSTVAEVLSISGPGYQADAVEVTAMDSPDQYREYIKGLISAGEVSVEMQFLPQDSSQDESAGILSKLESTADTNNFQIALADSASTTFEFAAVTTGFSIETPMEDKATATATFQISGKPTITSS